ncbi:MAG TPA: enoyl-[acyl-carrier-protein] reductase FabK, partial [Bacillota bacterium]|nr:enoyl-[acyl-carrier-protein] reductase FabK [Bacillota bacterium]
QFEEAEKNCIDPAELEQLGIGKARAAMQEGDVNFGSLMAGQISGMVKEIKPAATIIQEIMAGAEKVLDNLATLK